MVAFRSAKAFSVRHSFAERKATITGTDTLSNRFFKLRINSMTDPTDSPTSPSLHFIQEIVEADNASGKHDGRVHTRFPPEPNGYLHIGHAKSICLNFGLAQQYGGKTNLRFDDTNPTKEDDEYVESIKEDVQWLGFEWDNLFFASEYFEQLYEYAVQLIKQGDAYVCDLNADETREYRGTPTEVGKNSPFRDRSVDENVELFAKMKAGEFGDGTRTLRAKIDMSSPNLNMRDPVMYRILHAHHHRTGDKWCIYPMYDFAHGQSDSLERITHSICTLEFEDHRPLYDWFVEKLGVFHPQQIEFARLNLTHTVMSKRKLLQLVQEELVSGWNDPRMPTISGLRRRGYTPASLRSFCQEIGVSKTISTIGLNVLENAIRDDLNATANRVMAVLNPVKLVIDNYPEDETEEFEATNNPNDESAGKRKLPFGKELYIERDDFMEDPPKKFFRLSHGKEVRLRYACIIKCVSYIKNDEGEITEIHCTYDPESKSGMEGSKRKVKGTIHWVSAAHALSIETRLYSHLFTAENPDKVEEGQDWKDGINPESLITKQGFVEPSVANAKVGERFQFERNGYFCVDSDSAAGRLVFNRTVTLKDAWAKIKKKKG